MLLMNIPTRLAVALAGLTLLAFNSPAQERRPGGQEGRGRDGGGLRANPLFAALDTNRDNIIDEKEMANAQAALKKLDKNNDGKLTEDELRPAPRSSAEAGEEMVKRLMEFDKNADGKLSKEELPERMQGMFERADADHDGFLSKDEIKKLAEARGAAGGPGGPGGPGREGGERRPPPPGDK